MRSSLPRSASSVSRDSPRPRRGTTPRILIALAASLMVLGSAFGSAAAAGSVLDSAKNMPGPVGHVLSDPLAALDGASIPGDTARARVVPATAHAGQVILLVLEVDPGLPLSPAGPGGITCTVTGPDGLPTSACVDAGTRLGASISDGSTRTYSFPYTVPAAVGSHLVEFAIRDLGAADPSVPRASAAFHVDPAPAAGPVAAPASLQDGTPASILDPGANTGQSSSSAGHAEASDSAPPPGSESQSAKAAADAVRVMLVLVVATGVLLFTLVAIRTRTGGAA